MFYIDEYYLILVLPMMIFSMLVSALVRSRFNKYSRMLNSRGLTGAAAAQEILRNSGVYGVKIEQVSGNLTDHYDPKTKVIRLSEGVYNKASVSAVGVACHEAGHAIQDANEYSPLRIRNAIFPVVNIASNAWFWLFLLGLILDFGILTDIGLILFAFIIVFQLVTLPVEFNASRRALANIRECGLLYDEELTGARKVLSAAAMTYVASLAVSIAQFARLLLSSSRRD